MRRQRGGEPTTQPRGLGGWLRDIVDRSIGMYLVRGVRGRLSHPRHRRWIVRDLRADEVAYRIGATGTTHRAAVAIRGRPTRASTVRRQLVRDTAVALAGLAAIAVVSVNLWPRTEGGVLGATATPPALTQVPTPDPTPTP